MALDRATSKSQKRESIQGLRCRPVIVKDLSIFGTPRSQSKRRSRSRKNRTKLFDENLNLMNQSGEGFGNGAFSHRSAKSAKSAKSVKSNKSARSNRSARVRSCLKRNESVVKLSSKLKPKSARKNKRKRMKSMDSDEIERLHNPKSKFLNKKR
jgi:hypothetical protein